MSQKLNQEILDIVNKILTSKIGILEGCRVMLPLLDKKGINNRKEFLIFTGVESETDHLPLGITRKKWNKDKLLLKDKEIKKAESYYKNDVFDACRKLVEFLNHPYKEFEDTKLWKFIEKALKDLIKNNDIKITTSEEYVIGYLCKEIKKLNVK